MSNKNSFLKFLIVSHEGSSSRWVKFPIIFLFILIILVIVVSIFFLKNLGKYVDITSVDALRSDNQRLKMKVEQLKEQKDWLEAVSDSITNAQRAALETHHIGKPDEGEPVKYQIDTLLLYCRWIDTIIKASLAQDDSIIKMIPSVLPVEGYIVNFFGKEMDPFTGKLKPHNGVNILASLNSPVISTGDGKVLGVGQRSGAGLCVEIAHRANFTTLYGHLLSTTVKKGESVKRGDVIGYVGQSGRAPYPYLYYEVKRDTVFIDPLNVIFEEL